MPVATTSPIMHELVRQDLLDRLNIGVKRYGQPLQGFNGRNALKDAYDEVLDQSVYLRQAIFEQTHGKRIDGTFTDVDSLLAEMNSIVVQYIPVHGRDSFMMEKMKAWMRSRASEQGWDLSLIRIIGEGEGTKVMFDVYPSHLGQSVMIG